MMVRHNPISSVAEGGGPGTPGCRAMPRRSKAMSLPPDSALVRRRAPPCCAAPEQLSSGAAGAFRPALSCFAGGAGLEHSPGWHGPARELATAPAKAATGCCRCRLNVRAKVRLFYGASADAWNGRRVAPGSEEGPARRSFRLDRAAGRVDLPAAACCEERHDPPEDLVLQRG